MATSGHLLGTDPLALRLPSVALGVLAIASIYAAGAALFGREVGLIAALFSAVSPPQISRAQEMRTYPLLLFLGWLSVYLLVRVLRTRSRRGWLVYAIVTLLLVYSHNTAILIIAGQALYVLAMVVQGGTRPAVLTWLAGFWALAYAGVVVFGMRLWARVPRELNLGVDRVPTLPNLLRPYEELAVATDLNPIALTVVLVGLCWGVSLAFRSPRCRPGAGLVTLLVATPLLAWMLAPTLPFGR